MDHSAFDDLARTISTMRDRRTLAKVLGATALAPALGAAFAQLGDDDDAGAAKKNRASRKPRKYRKKRKFCLNGQQVKTRRKKRIRRWKQQGATKGKCPAACPAGSVNVNGACTPCTVTCASDAATCGAALQNALTAGGTVYVCPGTYGGNFTTDSVTVYGAGAGADAASNTILDGQGTGRALLVNDNATVALTSLRFIGGAVTNGNGGGGGISAGFGANLTVTNCAASGNTVAGKDGGGGLYALMGTVLVQDSQFSGNTADNGGGIRFVDAVSATIRNCTITDNVSSVFGGGVGFGGSNLTMTGTTISNNTAGANGGGGGGVNIDTPNTLILDSATAITSNTAIGGTGGGIRGEAGSSVQRNGATISGNNPTECDGVTGC